MAWLAVDKDGKECVYYIKPSRDIDSWFTSDYWVELPKGSIEKLIGRELTWNDKPVEI